MKPLHERLLIVTCISLNLFLLTAVALVLSMTLIPMFFSMGERGYTDSVMSADSVTEAQYADLQLPPVEEGDSVECVTRDGNGNVTGSSSSSGSSSSIGKD